LILEFSGFFRKLVKLRFQFYIAKYDQNVAGFYAVALSKIDIGNCTFGSETVLERREISMSNSRRRACSLKH